MGIIQALGQFPIFFGPIGTGFDNLDTIAPYLVAIIYAFGFVVGVKQVGPGDDRSDDVYVP